MCATLHPALWEEHKYGLDTMCGQDGFPRPLLIQPLHNAEVTETVTDQTRASLIQPFHYTVTETVTDQPTLDAGRTDNPTWRYKLDVTRIPVFIPE
ncbi:hypothetical protein RRG08_025984 [Elysia crispata]|uniref:Uncharacterized protein n=1 Tax=Elysia crispata TaxID=231223 RepID=A0AAE0ZGZ5_9GAST|nr:hypothetical protein RRG08_025984 [Elysia crispata]